MRGFHCRRKGAKKLCCRLDDLLDGETLLELQSHLFLQLCTSWLIWHLIDMLSSLDHWGYLSQKHTVWREGGGSLTAPTIVHHIWYSTSITLVTGMVQATFWIFGFGVLSRLWAFVPVCLYIADADVNDICSNICQSAPTCPQHVCQRKRLESNGKVYF